VTGFQATLVNRIGPAPKIICGLIAEITHGLMAQALGLGLGQVVQAVLDAGIKSLMVHGGLQVGWRWF
jgi:hypothetical protein